PTREPARLPRLGHLHAQQPGGGLDSRSVHSVGSEEQPAPGRLRLVRHAGQALVRRAPALVAGAALALAGCGGHNPSTDRGDLVWSKQPLLFRATHLPNDRVLIGTVRNRSKHPLHIIASKIAVQDAGGARLRGYAVFLSTFAHGLYGAYQRPKPL